MKVSFLNSTTYGGAAIATIRIIEALNPFLDKKSLTVGSGNKNLHSYIHKYRFYEAKTAFYHILEQSYFYLFGTASDRILTLNKFGVISKNDIDIGVDIIHLHWINRGFLSLKMMKEMGEFNKPIIWTLHDMSAFTGICSYAENCTNFTDGCGNCQYLKKNNALDLSHKNYLKKENIYKKLNLYIVTCSEWLKKEAERSRLFENIPVYYIPNPINTAVFKPVKDKKKLRKKYNIPIDTKIILFGAAKLTIPRKGFIYFKESLKHLSYPIEDVLILLIGDGEIIESIHYKTFQLDKIEKIDKIIEIYNLADVCIVPSLQDNFPNMVIESMSCETPVVGFETGGIPEIVQHKENGYIATVEDSIDLAKGIEWVFENQEIASKAARKKILANYSYKIVGQKYYDLYRKVSSAE